jgi:hypothetical protein
MCDTEMTPLDVAACYADYEVWNIIKKKEDSLPPVKDKKKKKKKPRRRGNEAPPLPKVRTREVLEYEGLHSPYYSY